MIIALACEVITVGTYFNLRSIGQETKLILLIHQVNMLSTYLFSTLHTSYATVVGMILLSE